MAQDPYLEKDPSHFIFAPTGANRKLQCLLRSLLLSPHSHKTTEFLKCLVLLNLNHSLFLPLSQPPLQLFHTPPCHVSPFPTAQTKLLEISSSSSPKPPRHFKVIWIEITLPKFKKFKNGRTKQNLAPQCQTDLRQTDLRQTDLRLTDLRLTALRQVALRSVLHRILAIDTAHTFSPGAAHSQAQY